MSSSSRDLPPCELIPLQDWSLEHQKNKENLLQRPCGPVPHHTVCEAARSNSIGSLFFLHCVITRMYASFVIYMLMGI